MTLILVAIAIVVPVVFIVWLVLALCRVAAENDQ